MKNVWMMMMVIDMNCCKLLVRDDRHEHYIVRIDIL